MAFSGLPILATVIHDIGFPSYPQTITEVPLTKHFWSASTHKPTSPYPYLHHKKNWSKPTMVQPQHHCSLPYQTKSPKPETKKP